MRGCIFHINPLRRLSRRAAIICLLLGRIAHPSVLGCILIDEPFLGVMRTASKISAFAYIITKAIESIGPRRLVYRNPKKRKGFNKV